MWAAIIRDALIVNIMTMIEMTCAIEFCLTDKGEWEWFGQKKLMRFVIKSKQLVFLVLHFL